MTRLKLCGFVASIGLLFTSVAAAGKPPQVAKLANECEDTILTIRTDWKGSVVLLKSQLETIELQVKQGSQLPGAALTSVVGLANQTRVAILVDAAARCEDLVEVAKDLVTEMGGKRPADFLIGGGGVVDQFHQDLDAELEKARKKIESRLREFRDVVFASTSGGYDMRFVLPKVVMPRMLTPGRFSSYAGIEWLRLPDTILVLAGARPLVDGNVGTVHVAGRITSIDLPQPLPDLLLFGTQSAQLKSNVVLAGDGSFQTSFTSLPSRDYELRIEQDPSLDMNALDTGLELIEYVSIP